MTPNFLAHSEHFVSAVRSKTLHHRCCTLLSRSHRPTHEGTNVSQSPELVQPVCDVDTRDVETLVSSSVQASWAPAAALPFNEIKIIIR